MESNHTLGLLLNSVGLARVLQMVITRQISLLEEFCSEYVSCFQIDIHMQTNFSLDENHHKHKLLSSLTGTTKSIIQNKYAPNL